MITSWDIYWITRLDGIATFFGALIFVSIVALAIWIIFYFVNRYDSYDKPKEEYLKAGLFWSRISFSILFFASISFLLIPSTKEVAAIYLIPKIANNEQMQKIPDNLAKLLNVKMEEWINDSIASKPKKESK